jgi:molybdopterin-guanine dinucleotide biosynthesis protein A
MVGAAILAGGRASRLGGRMKALLPLGEARIIDHQLAALGACAAPIVIVANDPEPFSALGVPVVADRIPGAGAIGGLLTGIGETGAPATIVIACDLPFVTAAFLGALAGARGDSDVVVPRTADGLHPLCACWSAAAMPVLERQIARGHLRIIDALDALRVREMGPGEVAQFDSDGTLLFNVNTPHDYTRALQRVDRTGRR